MFLCVLQQCCIESLLYNSSMSSTLSLESTVGQKMMACIRYIIMLRSCVHNAYDGPATTTTTRTIFSQENVSRFVDCLLPILNDDRIGMAIIYADSKQLPYGKKHVFCWFLRQCCIESLLYNSYISSTIIKIKRVGRNMGCICFRTSDHNAFGNNLKSHQSIEAHICKR